MRNLFKAVSVSMLLALCIMGSVKADTNTQFKRLAGDSRYDTAIKIATQYLDGTKTNNIVLASGNDFPDAISGGLFCKQKKAPMLLISNNKNIDDQTLNYAYSNINAGGTFYILGGNAAVNTSIDTLLKSKGYNVVRFAGKDRYETCKLINEQVTLSNKAYTNTQKVILADGENFADCLCANSEAVMSDEVFLIAPKNHNSSYITNFIKSKPFNYVLVVGNLNTENVDKIYGISDVGLERGDNIYDTSRECYDSAIISSALSNKYESVIIGSGNDYPDGLTGSTLVGKYNAPLILMNSTDNKTSSVFTERSVCRTIILGGTKAVSSDVESFVKSKLVSNAEDWNAVSSSQLTDEQIKTIGTNFVNNYLSKLNKYDADSEADLYDYSAYGFKSKSEVVANLNDEWEGLKSNQIDLGINQITTEKTIDGNITVKVIYNIVSAGPDVDKSITYSYSYTLRNVQGSWLIVY